MNYIQRLTHHLPSIQPELLEEFFNERAAIREYEGNMTREKAELEAYHDTIREYALMDHIQSVSSINSL